MKIMEDKLTQSGLPLPNALDNTEEHCPSCLEVLPARAVECSFCHIVISHFKRASLEARLKTTVPGLSHLSAIACEELEQAWRKTEALYADSETHHHFLHICYRHKALSYAVKKYNELLEKNPMDDVAEVMRKRAVVLAQSTVPDKPSAAAVSASELEFSGNQQHIMRYFNYVMTLSLVSGVVILMASGLTQNKMFFFGLGFFLCVSSVMALLFMKRELA